jgi:hypothetical protein
VIEVIELIWEESLREAKYPEDVRLSERRRQFSEMARTEEFASSSLDVRKQGAI